MLNRVRYTLIGSVIFPGAVTIRLLLGGYDLGGFGQMFPYTLIYLAGLMIVGGTAGFSVWGSRERHPAYVLVTVYIIVYAVFVPFDPLFAMAPWDGSTVLDFTYDALLCGLLSVGIVALIELYRAPDRVKQIIPFGSRRVVIVAASGHVFLALYVRSGIFGIPAFGSTPFGFGLGVWLLVGATIEAGLPALAFVRFRVVTPAVLLGGLFTLTAWETWTMVRTTAALSVAITPFTFYLAAWFVIIPILAIIGSLEYYGRKKFKSHVLN